MAESGLVYLLTGSNRGRSNDHKLPLSLYCQDIANTHRSTGIGRAALGDLLLRPSTTVVAAVRDIEHESATTLSSLPLAEGSKLHMVALNEKEASINADTLPERLRALGITHIDIVVANGGGSVAFRPVLEARADELASDFETNVLAPMRLFQACWSFLAKSDGTDTRRKKFIYVSSSTGSIGVQMMMEHFPSTGYGTSKAAGNWLAASISLEHKKDGLKVGIFHPG